MIGFGKAVGDILHVCLPLTPTANEMRRWNVGQWARHRKTAEVAVRASYFQACGIDEKWRARRALVAYVRCGEGTRPADPDNVVLGCKAAMDAIVQAGAIPDDDPGHIWLDRVVSLCKSEWTERFPGPATHLVLVRYAGVAEMAPASAILRPYLDGREIGR